MNEKEILDNAPDDNWTHVSDNNVYYWNKPDGLPHVWWARGEEWIDSPVHHFLRSRKDIERIVELEAQSQWISVEDRLPESDDTYICLDIPAQYKALFERGKFIPATEDIFGCMFENGKFAEISFSGGDIDVPVTHWMPLPAPPSGGEL